MTASKATRISGLARALQESAAARVDAVRDALAFRKALRALYAGSRRSSRSSSLRRQKRRSSRPFAWSRPGSAPSLIVHGAADTSVPIDQGETMYAALTKAGVPASFIRSVRPARTVDGDEQKANVIR